MRAELRIEASIGVLLRMLLRVMLGMLMRMLLRMMLRMMLRMLLRLWARLRVEGGVRLLRLALCVQGLGIWRVEEEGRSTSVHRRQRSLGFRFRFRGGLNHAHRR